MTLFIYFCLSLLFPVAAPGSAPGANRTPFRIHSDADNVSTSRFPETLFQIKKQNKTKQPKT